MNTFRRPMFRGGKVDSRGTGITSGLSYGGRVGLQGGGMPPTGSTFNINMGGRTPIPTGSNIFRPPMVINTGRTYSRPIGPPRGGLSGGSLGSRLLSRSMNLPFVGKAMRPLFGGLGGGATLATGGAGLFGLGALGGIGIGQLADFYARGSSTPEGYARLKEMGGPNFNFDETNIDVGEVFKYIDEGNQMGEKYGFFPRGGKAKRLEEMGLTGTYDPDSGERLENPLGDKKEEKALTPEQLRILELEKLIEGMTKVDPKVKDTDTEESVEIDKEKFAKILGKDKARGQDISDMLLSFSSKALAPDATVKSAFAEFAADEVKRPSRARKIDDSAAALAINKYIKGEISKQEADTLIKRLELQSKLTADRTAKTAAEYIQASDAATFSGRVKEGLNSAYSRQGIVPSFKEVTSKEMDDPEKFKFGPEDVGIIFIETDTKKAYSFDEAGNEILIYQG
jgi:hypothetical protein